MTKSKGSEFALYSVNFTRLRRFNFDNISLEEAVLFEFFISMAQNWDFGEWYHTTDQITNDTGVKRATIEKIIKKFKSKGYINWTLKGLPAKRFYSVNIPEMGKLLPVFYKFTENSKLESEICKVYAEICTKYSENSAVKKANKEINKSNSSKESHEKENDIEGFAIKKSFSSNELDEARALLLEIDDRYNLRRKNKNTSKVEYPKTALPKGKNIIKLAALSLQYKTKLEILNSFTAYVDNLLETKIFPSHILNYFFTIKDEEFDVIDNFLEFYNKSYQITKSK